jgi:hypothetical protein
MATSSELRPTGFVTHTLTSAEVAETDQATVFQGVGRSLDHQHNRPAMCHQPASLEFLFYACEYIIVFFSQGFRLRECLATSDSIIYQSRKKFPFG